MSGDAQFSHHDRESGQFSIGRRRGWRCSRSSRTAMAMMMMNKPAQPTMQERNQRLRVLGSVHFLVKRLFKSYSRHKIIHHGVTNATDLADFGFSFFPLTSFLKEKLNVPSQPAASSQSIHPVVRPSVPLSLKTRAHCREGGRESKLSRKRRC